MLPIPKKVRPPKDPNAARLYPEADTLKLPSAAEAIHIKEQKEITYPLTRAHRKTGYPRLFGPVGVKQVPAYFIDRAKDIAQELKNYHARHEKTKHYYDSCAYYDPLDPDLLYNQGVYHAQFNEYTETLEKVEQCLKINPRDYRALLLKADTYFRMCDFETALLCYSQGINLKFPYRNWFLDGYYRTTALLYDLTRGDLPLFYGGNMNVFYRLVQGQERGTQRTFNDTYKHYDELYPLEPNLTGVQQNIDMFHVVKPEPPNQVRRVWKAAMQQLKGARKCLGSFWDCKMEIEKHLIKQEHHLPRFGRSNQIDRALKFMRARIEKFEVICTLMKSRQLRANYDRPVDWLLEYGRWMADKTRASSIPPAETGGLHSFRYKWVLSNTLFDIREKPMDICWIRKHGRQTQSNHLLPRRRSWKYMCGYKSAKRGALAALRSGGHDWPFMQKLKRTVWNELESYAPAAEAVLPMPEHIEQIERQIEDYEQIKANHVKASKLIMPVAASEDKGKLYYDPDTNEQQWDKNREIVRNAQLKRNKASSLLPLPTEHRPIPANLLEVFEAKAHEDPGVWSKRRKMSLQLREELAKAEAVKAAHAAQEKHGLFGPTKTVKKEVVKAKTKVDSDLDITESVQAALDATVVKLDGSLSAVDGEKATVPTYVAATPLPTSADDEENVEDEEEVSIVPERKTRRPGERPRYDILNKKPDREYEDKPHVKRRVPKRSDANDCPPPVVVEERVRTQEELEAERLLAARTEDPIEIAWRIFDNQKAALLEKSYSALMTCTKVSEFLEVELEIGDLLSTCFPPQSMRFPNGDPIILEGYPEPSEDFTRMIPSEMFASRKKRKKKFDDEGAVTAAEAAREADGVQRLMQEKGRMHSLTVEAQKPAVGPVRVMKPVSVKVPVAPVSVPKPTEEASKLAVGDSTVPSGTVPPGLSIAQAGSVDLSVSVQILLPGSNITSPASAYPSVPMEATPGAPPDMPASTLSDAFVPEPVQAAPDDNSDITQAVAPVPAQPEGDAAVANAVAAVDAGAVNAVLVTPGPMLDQLAEGAAATAPAMALPESALPLSDFGAIQADAAAAAVESPGVESLIPPFKDE